MRPPAGFVLVATLWILAGLAVLAAYINNVAASSVERAALWKGTLERELDRRNTETTLIYLLATNRRNYHALVLAEEQRFGGVLEVTDATETTGREIAVTGQAYLGLGDIRFAIEDEAGLVSVNSPDVPALAATLEHVGISRHNAARIAARTRDYVDMDGVQSLNGAERFAYVRRNRPPPPNWIMATPMELKKVIDVDDLISPAQWIRLRPLLTMRQAVGYNFNTMHPDVVAALLDDRIAVAKVLATRADRPVAPGQLGGLPTDIDAMELRILPSDNLRISTWHTGGDRRLAGIHLAPYMDGAPWRLDYRYTEPAINDDANTVVATPSRPETVLFQQP